MMYQIVTPALLLIFLTACGARQAAPIPEASALDDRLSCAHLTGELETNTARITELQGEGERRSRDNMGMLLLNPIAGVAFMDSGNTQQTESGALARRNERLLVLQQQRGCAVAR